ncbi:OFA family MFS transporter [Salmonella enterica]|uniref:MFS transporter n=5 Tax=Salmonella enterica TaxID=28901 RepID=A0A5V3WR43_SALER|nr:OFA family MFS transporter [Salmonella enterica]ECC9939806.1 MFS transporter [Salmonella enterica subsp. enterica]ECD7244358.1 MFS transporter [Salmonella enterica subsp. enterica serovar Florida]ECT8497273.1 MFS transporter [Salmonella enterica subsp. enterica serovar Pensacola]EDD5837781.1 MFS transporter [Salmonella enterica subsp. enterica serovar Enteritidis]EDO3332284.1 MFS transporter [Salmonella enterica subsp. enterica serovar Infantis]EDQ0311778.1 OFA family MFS transporter [Salm
MNTIASTNISERTDKEILGFSRWWMFVLAFLAMSVISPYEYAWSVIAPHLGDIYGWESTKVSLMFTMFVICQAFGTLPGGILRDKFGPKLVSVVAGIFSGIGLLVCAFGQSVSYSVVLVVWCIGCFFCGFIYNAAITTCNKWFPDNRNITTGLMSAAFSWGALPFIFPIQSIPKNAPDSTFFNVIFVMAAIISGVIIITGLFMKDPPKGWTVTSQKSRKLTKRPCEKQYSMGEAMCTWQFWVLIVSFVLVSGAGLTFISKSIKFASAFHFSLAAGTVMTIGIAITSGLSRVVAGWISDKIGVDKTMTIFYILCGLFSLLALYFAEAGSSTGFITSCIVSIFFWGALYSLFASIVGYYYGEVASGSNYGMLYATAKGLGGIYGGVLSAYLISTYGNPFIIIISSLMALLSGVILLPLWKHPPVWKTVRN